MLHPIRLGSPNQETIQGYEIVATPFGAYKGPHRESRSLPALAAERVTSCVLVRRLALQIRLEMLPYTGVQLPK